MDDLDREDHHIDCDRSSLNNLLDNLSYRLIGFSNIKQKLHHVTFLDFILFALTT
jgi:hypothetical protein